jgi:hypothetical protein
VCWSTGNPYPAALELTDSGDVEAVQEGLRILDDLVARPAATLTRRTVRGVGRHRRPARPEAHHPHHPAGLTDASWTSCGCSPVAGPGVTSRRDAVAAAAALGIDPTGVAP